MVNIPLSTGLYTSQVVSRISSIDSSSQPKEFSYNTLWTLCFVACDIDHKPWFRAPLRNWLVVSTHLKNISQIGNLPQLGVKIKYLKPPPRKAKFPERSHPSIAFFETGKVWLEKMPIEHRVSQEVYRWMSTRVSMVLSNHLVSSVVTYLGDWQLTYIGVIIYLLSTMDIPVG